MPRFAPFKLERYFAQYEFKARYLLSASDCESLTLAWQIKEKRRVAFGLEGIAARLGASWRAVQLFGAAAALRAMIGAPLPPSDGPVYTERVNTLRGYLGGPTFADAWTAGQALPLEQAVALALGEAEKCATLAI